MHFLMESIPRLVLYWLYALLFWVMFTMFAYSLGDAFVKVCSVLLRVYFEENTKFFKAVGPEFEEEEKTAPEQVPARSTKLN